MKDTEITVTITLRTEQCSKDSRTKAIFKKDQGKKTKIHCHCGKPCYIHYQNSNKQMDLKTDRKPETPKKGNEDKRSGTVWVTKTKHNSKAERQNSRQETS